MTLQRKATPPPTVPLSLDQLLTIPQTASYLGISRSKLYRLLRDPRNGLPVVRMPGRTTRIPAARLQVWIEQHTEQTS